MIVSHNPIQGSCGTVINALIQQWGMDLIACSIHDLRRGERVQNAPAFRVIERSGRRVAIYCHGWVAGVERFARPQRVAILIGDVWRRILGAWLTSAGDAEEVHQSADSLVLRLLARPKQFVSSQIRKFLKLRWPSLLKREPSRTFHCGCPKNKKTPRHWSFSAASGWRDFPAVARRPRGMALREA